MRHSIYIVAVIIITLFFSSCKSKEEKVAEIIKMELSKTLYDFQSYDPIETTVNEAKLTAYNDTTCFRLAMAISYNLSKATKAFDEAKRATESMDIWGPPSAYSLAYSDKQYYKYRDEAKDKREEGLAAFARVKTLGCNLEDSIKVLDDTKIIGWEVRHCFRCKTKGGQNTIANYRYIIDPQFKRVLFVEDMDDDDFMRVRELISEAIDGNFSKLDLNN